MRLCHAIEMLANIVSIVLRSVLILWHLFYISSLFFPWYLFFPLCTVVAHFHEDKFNMRVFALNQGFMP
jgi:hypothetical protein